MGYLYITYAETGQEIPCNWIDALDWYEGTLKVVFPTSRDWIVFRNVYSFRVTKGMGIR